MLAPRWEEPGDTCHVSAGLRAGDSVVVWEGVRSGHKNCRLLAASAGAGAD